MKVKNLLLYILCLAMFFSLCVPVNAAEVTSNQTQDVTVFYGMDEGFVVNIPADFSIDTETKKSTVVVSANDVMIEPGSVLYVIISGDDYVNSWELINNKEANTSLTYTIGTTEGASDIVNDSVVLSVASGEGVNEVVDTTLYFTVIDELLKAGNYTDTLTFTIGVDIVTGYEVLAIDDIMDDEGNARMQVGDSVQLNVAATYGLRQPTWESSNDEVVTVSSTGLATAVGNGNAVVTYTMGDMTGEIPFIIGEGNTLAAGLYDASGVMLASWDELEAKGLDLEKDWGATDRINEETPNHATQMINNDYPEADMLVISNKVIKLGEYALNETNLSYIVVPGSVKTIKANAFEYALSENIELQEGIQIIEERAFDGASFTSVVLPKSITHIGDNAFTNSYSLKSIVLGGDLEEISGNAFGVCQYLETIYFRGTEVEWNNLISAEDIQYVGENTDAGHVEIVYNYED